VLNLTVHVVSTVLNSAPAVFMFQKLNRPGCSEEINTFDHSSLYTVYCYMIRLKWTAIIRQCKKIPKDCVQPIRMVLFQISGISTLQK